MKRSLKWIDFYFQRTLQAAFRHPRFNLILCFVLFAFFALSAQRLKQTVSMTDQLDPGMRSTQELKRTKELFGAQTSLGFIVEPRGDFFQWTDLCLIQKQVNEIVFAHPQVEGFMSPYKIRQAVATIDKLSYPRLLPSPCETSLVAESNPLSPLMNSPWNSVVTDRNARDFAVSLRVRDLEVPGRYGSFDPGAVDDLIHSIQEKIPLKTWVTGTAAQQLYMMKGLAQTPLLNLLVILIVGGGFRLLFGTWRSGAIFLFTLFFSTTLVFGLMGLLGYPIDPLSSCLFLMIAVASIQDFIFISYDRMKSERNYKHSFRQLITPSFFTSLTTVLGFGSLVISHLQSIRRFGALAALGSMLEWACVFLIVPSFMILFPSWQNWVRRERAWFYRVSQAVTLKSPPRGLARLSLLVFVGAGFAVQNFKLSQNPSEVFPRGHPFQQGMEYIKKTRGWVADASLVFEKNLNSLRRAEILATVAQDPLVTRTETYDQVEKFVSQNIPAAPLTQDLVSDELKHSSFSERYNADSGEGRAILYLQTTDTEKLNQLREKVVRLCPQKECWLAGEFIGFADFSMALIHTLFDSLFLSLCLVALVIFYLTRATGKKYFWAAMLSALWGPAWMLVSIYLFGLSVNFVTCIVASTLVGLTGDNAIQYMFGGRHLEKGIENRGIGSIQCAIIMALCCLTFTGSYFEPPRTLGILLSAGFIVSLLGDLWVLKALLKPK